MIQTVDESVVKGYNAFKTTIFKLVREGNSAFIKDGTEHSGKPISLKHGKFMALPMYSRLYLGAGKGYIKIQYVIGAPTHYIDNYYEDAEGNFIFERLTPESAKDKGYFFRPGLTSLGYDEKRLREEMRAANELAIGFEFGIMELKKHGNDPILLRFINEHLFNTKAPNADKNNDPKMLRLFMFEPLIKEAVASKDKIVENFDEDAEAILFTSKLRTKTKTGFEYDVEMMDMILKIMDDGHGLGKEDVNQKFKIIARATKADGKTFMELINTGTQEYKTEIIKAIQFKVIELKEKGVLMLQGTKKASIYTLTKGDSKDEAIQELIKFFIVNPIGAGIYPELIRQTEIAKIAALKD